ncbi:PKD family protein [Chitinophaga skermanii]|uniref:PKD family protein n=1 Tax=Chitinophaga skermanii TaxID=331697 RepID=A0A327QS44_9BACT|nr:PKD-like family lipoprotein [Chitinophaga skermanii]RAJ06464.1 PKD family protein [Chitinophaga skermanii]
MKKVSLYIAGLLSLLYACKKDDSTLNTQHVGSVYIDTAGIGAQSVYQFDTLRIRPNLQFDGQVESDFTYEWKINMAPNDTMYQVLGTARALAAEIRFRPNSASQYHQLVYTVTNKANGLRYIMPFKITVLNNIGEGLVIADSEDGRESDISHLMMPWITANATTTSLKRNVYSSINHGKIGGIVKQMRYYRSYTTDVITGITDSSIFNIKTLDYTFGGKNNDLFFAPRGAFKPQSLGSIYQGDLYIGEGKFTGTYMGASPKYPTPFDNNFAIPTQLALNPFNYDGLVVRVNFYDEVHGHFVYLSTIASYGDREMHRYPVQAGAAFNANNLPGKQNLAAGLSVDKDFLHLLKDKTTGKVSLYIFSPGIDDYPDIIPPSPKSVIDLTNAPGIATAHHFVFAEDQNVMYYVSGNKVYAMLYGTATPTYHERYTLAAGEEVTVLQVYQQGNYPHIEPTLSTNNKILIMATYSGGKGKLYLFPMLNLGLGNLDINNRKEYGDFGRISSVISQK